MRYKPIVREVEDLRGLAFSTDENLESKTVEVINRAFFQSDNVRGRFFMSAILQSVPYVPMQQLNRLLVVFRSGKAYIYEDFPLAMKIRAKSDIKVGPVYANQILNIEEVYFRDGFDEIDIRDSDKLIWLFRYDWLFGVYFDLTGTLQLNSLWNTLGNHFQQLIFSAIYTTMADASRFNKLLSRGWFPFVQLIGGDYERLVRAIDHQQNDELSRVEKDIVRDFSKERIDEISELWWTVDIYNKKKDLLNAGINAYNRGGTEDIVLSIKTLVSEIEGILKLDFKDRTGKRPPKHAVDALRHETGLSIEFDSLIFPNHFISYLRDEIFGGCDLMQEDVRISRHSATHGLADSSEYKRVFALQLILALDQIHFFLRK